MRAWMTLPDDGPLPGCLTSIIGLVSWLAICGALASVAHCQDRPPTEVLVARTFISEEGWDSAEGWASLGAVIRWRAASHHDGDLRAATIALSPRLHGEPCAVSRAWLCELRADGARPAGLGAPWARVVASLGRSRRDAWLATLSEARAIVAGTVPDPCTAEVRAWGSEADVRRRRLAGYGWRDVDCGDTRNRFGVVLRSGRR